MLKALLLDLSGVLYQGRRALPGAVEALARLRDTDLALRFVTNTSRRSRRQLLADLHRLGFVIDQRELFSAPRAAHQWLVGRGLRPWCLIHPDLREDFDDLDQQAPNAVLIGDAGGDFTYANMNRALRLLIDGAPLVTMGVNRYFQLDDGLHLDAGPFVKALEYAADCRATVTGKPAATFFQQVLADIGCDAGAAMMVGDDVFGDVEGALNAGLRGCLVRTGKYRSGDERRIDGRFRVEADVTALAAALAGGRG